MIMNKHNFLQNILNLLRNNDPFPTYQPLHTYGQNLRLHRFLMALFKSFHAINTLFLAHMLLKLH